MFVRASSFTVPGLCEMRPAPLCFAEITQKCCNRAKNAEIWGKNGQKIRKNRPKMADFCGFCGVGWRKSVARAMKLYIIRLGADHGHGALVGGVFSLFSPRDDMLRHLFLYSAHQTVHQSPDCRNIYVHYKKRLTNVPWSFRSIV